MAESIKVALELDDRGYQTKLNSAIDSTKKLGTEGQAAAQKATSGFDKMAASADTVVSKIKGLALAFVGLQQITSALQLADELSDLSKATDISIQKILGLQTALQGAGGNGEDAGRMISELMNTLDGARQGSADAQDQLFRLGFTLKDMANLTPEQTLEKTIASLAKMTNPIERNALAMQLLGRSARNIDWESVNQSLDANTEKYAENAEAIRKAGEIFDRFEQQTKSLKVSLMSSLEPLSAMLEFFDKLAGGGKGSFALNAFKTIFETIAVLAVTIGQGIKNIVGDIDALISAGGRVMKGDFTGAGDILKKRSEELKQASIDLDQVVAKIMYRPERDNQRPTMENDPRLVGRVQPNAPAKPPVKLALQGEIDAINQIAEAYAKANARAREKLQTDYDLAGSSDLVKRLTEETTKIQQSAADQIDKLQDKLKGLSDKQKRAGEAGAINKAIDAIKKDAETSIRLTQDIILANEERIRSIKDVQTAYELMNIAAGAGTEQFIAGQQRLKEMEDLRRQATLGPLERQLDQIAVAEERVAQARRAAIAAMPQFQAGEDGMNPDQAKAFARALAEVDLQRDRNIKTQQEQAQLTFEEQRTFEYGWQKAANGLKESLNPANLGFDMFNNMVSGMGDALVRFAQTGKLSFKDLANSIIADLIRIQVKKIAVGIFGEAGTGGGLLGGLLGGIGGFFGGLFRANGGPVTSNSPYIVGEKGPELFVPRSTGTIIPNNRLGIAGETGGGTMITYNIQAVDAASFKQLVARDPQFIYNVTEKGRRSVPSRSR